jgi:hypothetical protein
LAITAAEVFEKRWYALRREFNVLLPESRWESRKGFKDRCDILSLLRLETLDVKFLKNLLNRNRRWAGILRETVKKSVEEYMVLGLDPWKGRKSTQEMLKRIL